MKKAIIQGVVTISIFLGCWFVLSRVDWLKIFRVQQITEETEQKIGDLFWGVFEKSEEEIKDVQVINSIDKLVTHICKANKIDRSKLKIHVLKKDDINAFALPGGHLVIFSGLIKNSDNQEQLAGVIGHEIAHIELNHVVKKLVKEMGLSVIISMTTGPGGAEGIKQAAKMLSSSAFDRGLEKEADIHAVDYLLAAKINPEPFADFLFKISKKESEASKYMTWVSTHPDSRERAEYIIEYSSDKKTAFSSVLHRDSWEKLKAQASE